MDYSLIIRSKRQATFPNELLKKYDIVVGDSLVATDTSEGILLKPKKQVAMDAFKELQKAFQESGIPESEFQDAIRKDREEYARKKYPDLYRH